MTLKKKFVIVTTISVALNFFRGQLSYLGGDFDITAVTKDTGNLDEIGQRENVRVVNLPFERGISLLKDLKCLFLLIRLLCRIKPDIVHGNNPKGGLIAMVASRIASVPCRIYMCHGLRYQGSRGFSRWLLKCTEAISCRLATEVICVGSGVKDKLLDDRITNKEPVVISRGSANGIDAGYFNPVHFARDTARDWVEFTFVGRITRDKGINEMVEAFRMLCSANENVRLVLAGPWEDYKYGITDATKRELEQNPRITFTYGLHADIRPFLAKSDVLLLPSYREGLPTILLEAGAMRLPCIATDILGCNDVITDGENGLLVPVRDAASLYRAMKSMCDDRALRDTLAANSRRLVKERFDQEKLWKQYRELYRKLCGMKQ